jgi:tRNA A-37 threonylcarbamoyl transferase component Bud32
MAEALGRIKLSPVTETKRHVYYLLYCLPVAVMAIPWILGGIAPEVTARLFLLIFLAVIMTSGSAIAAISHFLGGVLKEQQELLVSQDGFVFPMAYISDLGGRRWRGWHELSAVLLAMDESGQVPKQLMIKFQDGKSVALPFSRMSPSNGEKLLVSLQMHAPPQLLGADLYEVQEALRLELKANDEPSYTEIWRDELNSRFSHCTYTPLPPGAALQNGRYRVACQLAFGGFAAVYLAENERKREVVLKEICVSHLNNRQTEESVLAHAKRESEILARLSHPQICALLDTFTEKGRNYLVLERISGKNLRQIVREGGALPEDEVVGLTLQMLDILEYLGRQSPPVVHRDFTPENLVLRHDHKVVLIDFNAAADYISNVTGTLVGKHAYVTPEQLRGKAEPRSDLYGLGCTMYFLLTGKDPEPLTVSEPIKQRVKVKPELNALIARLTQLDAADRPVDTAEVRESLRNIYRVVRK